MFKVKSMSKVLGPIREGVRTGRPRGSLIGEVVRSKAHLTCLHTTGRLSGPKDIDATSFHTLLGTRLPASTADRLKRHTGVMLHCDGPQKSKVLRRSKKTLRQGYGTVKVVMYVYTLSIG